MKRKIIPYKERTSISYFKNGVLCDVFPFDPNLSLYKNRNYESRFIVSDGVQYDLINKEDIQNIPIPHFSTNGWHTVDSLDYYLRMCASNLRSAKEFELSTLLLKKLLSLCNTQQYRGKKKIITDLFNGYMKMVSLKKLMSMKNV